MRTLIWWNIHKDGNDYICTLPDIRSLQSTGAHAAHGPFVPFPFDVTGPASEADSEWAEAELDKRIEDAEAQQRWRDEEVEVQS